MIKPPHPGETLKEDYLVPLDMSVIALAKAHGIGASRLNEIVRGERGEFWLNLQTLYDLRLAQKIAGSRIERKIQPRQAP